jgi:uncharacterized repeat protein (TIGR01451 family)
VRRVLLAALFAALVMGPGTSAVSAASSPLGVTVSSLPSSLDARQAGTFKVTVTNSGAPQTHPTLAAAVSLGTVTGVDPANGWQCSTSGCAYVGASAFKNHASATFTVHIVGPSPQSCDSSQTPTGSGHCAIAASATTTDDAGLIASASGQIDGVYPDIAVSASGPALTGAGSTVAYSARISNSGSGAASGVVLKDTLPALAGTAPTAFVVYEPAASSSSCGGAASAGVVTCTPDSVGAGSALTITVVVDAPALAAYAIDSQLQNGVAVSDFEEGATPLTPADDSDSAQTTVFDALRGNAGPGSSTSTPGLGNGHAQRTVVTLSSSVATANLTIDDSLSVAMLGHDTCPTGKDSYGNPVIVDAAKATVADPNTIQLIYASGPGGVPANEPLGGIQVTRQDVLGDNSTCQVLRQCGLVGKKSVIPSGAVACVASVKRQRPTGIVTIIILDSGGDPSFRGGG